MIAVFFFFFIPNLIAFIQKWNLMEENFYLVARLEAFILFPSKFELFFKFPFVLYSESSSSLSFYWTGRVLSYLQNNMVKSEFWVINKKIKKTGLIPVWAWARPIRPAWFHLSVLMLLVYLVYRFFVNFFFNLVHIFVR